MAEVYDEILNQSDIQNILEYYGLKVVKNKCTCPFHSDSHPSMSIHKNRRIAKCFACGAGGNAISFIQKYENEINHNSIGVRDAMQKAIDIQHLNITIPQNSNNVQLTEEQKKQINLRNILKDAITICENNLKLNNIDSKNSLEYLKSRNLSDKVINEFHIGFNLASNNITDELLTKYSLQDLIEVGIVKEQENGYKDIFSQRIMIPIFDANGYPVGFGARVLDNNTKPKYINTSATPLFNKSNLLFNYHKAKNYARDDEIIILEGYMDVISSKAMGFDNTVATMGTALTQEHIKLLKNLKCEITLSLDNDDAGKDAMIRIIPELLKEKLKVNVLDIGRLGNYKDFGDLQIANVPREKIYQTKISAFTFLMQEKYIKNKDLNVENIYDAFSKMKKDGLIKTSKDIMNFKEVIKSKSNFNNDEIENIINPTELKNQNRVDRYKNVYFYHYVLGIIKDYANKHQDLILLKYIELGKLDIQTILSSLDDEKFLKDGELTINIGSYIRDFIYKSENYINFKNDKTLILEKLLDNVKSFDSEGNIVDIELDIKQKQMVIEQYNSSFDQSVKNLIENSPDEFEELFIANSARQFEKLFPKSYVESLKEDAINRFKNDKVMEAVRYGLAYPESMKSAMNRQFVNNDKYKTLLVFNNTNNILSLSTDNIKKVQNEESKELEKENNTKEEHSKPMSVFIKLSGNEKETLKGMYLPINEKIEVYIPKMLYKKDDSRLEIINDNSTQANMSEYKVNSNTRVKEWLSRLSLDEFYHKYANMYEIQMEKEVMV